MNLTEYDTGLGTSYERLSIYSLIEKLATELDIKSSLEGPLDGITGINGINSIALARMGIRSTVVLPSVELIEYARLFFEAEKCQFNVEFICSKDLAVRRQFDLVWNFNCLPQLQDHEAALEQMARCSRRFILVFEPNVRNYGFWMHRLFHKVTEEPWQHGDVRLMDMRRVSKTLSQMGFRTVRSLYVDVPWWPDIHTPIEEVAGTFFPVLRRFLKKPHRLETFKYNRDNFPYFDEKRRTVLLKMLSAHPQFESSPIPGLKLFFAHHRGILAERIDRKGRS